MTLYAHVEEGSILALNIPANKPFGNTSFGKNSTDEQHIAVGLLPIVGSMPVYDSTIQTVSSPTYVVNGNQVDKVYVVTDIDLSVLKTKQKELIKQGFDAEVLQGFTTTSTIKMDLDPTLLNAGYELSYALEETEMTVRDYDNNSHTLVLADVLSIINELSVAWRTTWLKKVTLQDSIDTKIKASTIQGVTW